MQENTEFNTNSIPLNLIGSPECRTIVIELGESQLEYTFWTN